MTKLLKKINKKAEVSFKTFSAIFRQIDQIFENF